MASHHALKLDDTQKRMILERCPDLGGSVVLGGDVVRGRDVGARLIERLELTRYSREQVLFGFDEPPSERRLRIIVLGHVAVIQRQGQRQTVLSFGPMTTFGEEGVKAWNDGPLAAASPDQSSAIAKSDTWVLELPVTRFEEVFGAKRGENPLLRRILGAQKITELMPQIQKVLAATPELADVDHPSPVVWIEHAWIEVGDSLL